MSNEKINLAIQEDEKVVEIAIERLRDFKNHPFQVIEDEQMKDLMESVEKYGILNPLIVRPLPEGVYEIISGHRRKYAAEKTGYRKVPVIIRVMESDDATIAMIDSNLYRENIKPSEKGNAYQLKYEVLKRKKGRKKRGQIDHNTDGRRTVQIMADEYGESAKQIQRYIKITNLIPDLMCMVDNKEMGLTPAVEIAYLKKEEQKLVFTAIDVTQATPSLSQAQRIRRLSEEGTISYEKVEAILSEIKKGEIKRVEFKNEQLIPYFPKGYTPVQMKKTILELLKIFKDHYWNGQEEK